MKKTIVNTKLVMPDYIIPDGTVVWEDDTIVAYGKSKDIDTAGMEIIDAKGAFTGPGFIELHTHACDGVLFTEDPATAARNQLAHGVTDTLAALYFDTPAQGLMEQADRIRDLMKSGEAPNLRGLYMEAPYMNPKFGANRENNPWKDPITREGYTELLEHIYDIVKVWVVAPERENIELFVKDAKALNPDVVFAVGHSEAEPAQVEALLPYGMKLATHHTNATGTLNKYPECRGVCVDEAAWYNDDIYTELICDKVGIHVDPYMIRLVRKIKGDDRVVLIADAFKDLAPAPPGYEEATDINFDHMGEISGTKITLECACRNMMYNGGASIPQCFRYASTNPARVLGLWDRGSIGVGKKANLVICDGEFTVQTVILDGQKQ